MINMQELQVVSLKIKESVSFPEGLNNTLKAEQPSPSPQPPTEYISRMIGAANIVGSTYCHIAAQDY